MLLLPFAGVVVGAVAIAVAEPIAVAGAVDDLVAGRTGSSEINVRSGRRRKTRTTTGTR